MEVKSLDCSAQAAIIGGSARSSLFSQPVTGANDSAGIDIINQYFGNFNITNQIKQDVIYADNGAIVNNIGGISNTTAQSSLTASIEASIAAKMPEFIDSALLG